MYPPRIRVTWRTHEVLAGPDGRPRHLVQGTRRGKVYTAMGPSREHARRQIVLQVYVELAAAFAETRPHPEFWPTHVSVALEDAAHFRSGRLVQADVRRVTVGYEDGTRCTYKTHHAPRLALELLVYGDVPVKVNERYQMLMSWPPNVTSVMTGITEMSKTGPNRLFTPKGRPGAGLYRVSRCETGG